MPEFYYIIYFVDWLIFLNNRIKFWDCRQAFASFKHGFFQVWGKCYPQAFSNTRLCHSVGDPCNFVGLMVFYCCGRCLSHYCMALWCYLADVVALLPYKCNFCFLFGWCYSLFALVIKIDGDVFTIRLMFLPYWLMVLTILWLMVLPHWYSCTRNVPLMFVLFWLMLLPGWLMLLPSWGYGQMLWPYGWCYCHCLFD